MIIGKAISRGLQGYFLAVFAFQAKLIRRVKAILLIQTKTIYNLTALRNIKKKIILKASTRCMQRKNHMKMKDDFSVNKLGDLEQLGENIHKQKMQKTFF